MRPRRLQCLARITFTALIRALEERHVSSHMMMKDRADASRYSQVLGGLLNAIQWSVHRRWSARLCFQHTAVSRAVSQRAQPLLRCKGLSCICAGAWSVELTSEDVRRDDTARWRQRGGAAASSGCQAGPWRGVALLQSVLQLCSSSRLDDGKRSSGKPRW